ncbi:MATE family efflux transporter [Oceanimonas marisflavi]|uniref:hypothetical protein n=1 Tax=Oceanimonas marisflavi TaxID=2059724 RepID=UPI001300B53B|nr:hypothetical protein [Oceanimonas marisflavi]
MDNSILRLVNVSIRGITLLCKFLLVFSLALYLEPAEVGLYGLLVATIAYSMYPLGLDFYTYTTREILRVKNCEWGGILKNQGALILFLYFLVLPLLFFIFYFDFLPLGIAVWFYVVLVLEHINQELMRLFIATSRQLTATVALFFRQGLWVVFVIVWMFFDVKSRNLETVLYAWLFGDLLSLSLFLVRFKSLDVTGWTSKINFKWIFRGVKVAVPLLVSTLSLSGMFTFDKYFFELYNGLDALGAYVLFFGVSAALISFLDAGVFSFLYPKMIKAYNNSDVDCFRSTLFEMIKQVCFISLLYAVVTAITLYPLLVFIGKDFYLEHISLYPVLFLVMFFQGIGTVPQYALYSQGKDKSIVLSNIFSVFVFVFLVYAISSSSVYYAVPIALLVSQFLLAIFKFLACYYQVPKFYILKV